VNLTITILGLLISAATAIAAFGAWKAASAANRTATIVAAIERDRRHTELTPQFDITGGEQAAGGSAVMRVVLAGPPDLDRLDSVTIMIRDDVPDRKPHVAGGPTAEEIATVVWGPYRFVPGTDGADELGRGVAPVALRLGEGTRFALEPSLAPHWVSDFASWRRDYEGTPVRLTLICEREGREPWTIRREVHVEKKPKE